MQIELASKRVFSIDDGALLICLEDVLTAELVDAMIDAAPLQVICFDRAFEGNDELKANAVRAFKSRSDASGSDLIFKTV